MASKMDLIAEELRLGGFMTGNDTVMDGERKRLLSALVLAEPQNLSLYDLYSLNSERPRIL